MNRSYLLPAVSAAMLLALLPTTAATAQETIEVAAPASTSDTGAWATVSVPLSKGMTAQNISGMLSTTATTGELQLRVGQKTVKTVPVDQAGKFSLKLDDVAPNANGAIDVSARWMPEERKGQCLSSEPEQVEISNIKLQADGKAEAPKSVADFFAASPHKVSINASEQAAADALTAVPAIAAAFPNADVVWGDPKADLTVNFDLSQDPMTLSLDRSGIALNIAGSADQLAGLDSVIRSEAVKLAAGTQVEAVAESADLERFTPPSTMSFAQLGAQAPKLEGYGQSSIYVGVDEAAFGSSINSAQLHLAGTHSAIAPNTEAALNVYWNDSLIDSFVLDQNTSISEDIEIPAGMVKSGNGLRLQLDAAALSDNCRTAGALPVEVHLNGEASTITPNYGNSKSSGFQLLPQSAGGQLGLALADGASMNFNQQLATSLLASLQQSSAMPLKIQLTEPEDVAGSALSTVLVGATPQMADTLKSPLRLEEFRTIDAGALSAGVGMDTPYAVLEAFENSSRTIVMAGGWAPEGENADSLFSDLAAEVQYSNGGWGSLSRNLLIAQPNAEPVLLESNAVIPQPSVTDDYRVYGWWVAGGLAVLILAGAAGTIMYRRTSKQAKNQAQAEAAAQQAAAQRTDDLS